MLWDWLFEDSSDSSDSSSSSEDSLEDSPEGSFVGLSEDISVPAVETSAENEWMVSEPAMPSEPFWMRGQEKTAEAERSPLPSRRPELRVPGFIGGVLEDDLLYYDGPDFPPRVDSRVIDRSERPPHTLKKRAFGRQEREHTAREREARGHGVPGLALEAPEDFEALEGPARHSTVLDRVHRFPIRVGDDRVEFHGARHHERAFGPDGEFHIGRHHEGMPALGPELHGNPHHGDPFGSDADFHSGFRHGGLLREHSRQERGGHLRSRNRFPEEYENSEWFDSMDDGEGLVDVVLGFFFLIGAATLLLLPFFLLARALKRMGRRGGGRSHDGSGGNGFAARRRAHAANVAAAADGYQALPEDGGEEEEEEEELTEDDRDGIVVTGTPVNPPPSVHL